MPVHYSFDFDGSVVDDLVADYIGVVGDLVADYIVVDGVVADYIVAVDVVARLEVVPIDDLQLQPQRLFSCEAQLVYL